MKQLTDVLPLRLIEKACEFQGVELDDIVSKSRKQELVMARMLSSYMLLYLGFSLSFTGKLVGRDHSNICHYKKVFKDDRLFRDTLRRFTVQMRKFRYSGRFKDGKEVLEEGFIIPGYEKWAGVLRDREQTKMPRDYKREQLT